jgi:hypothetical protein
MTNKDCCSFNVGGGSRFFVQKPDKWSKYPAIQNVDIACKELNNVESIDFCDGTYIGPGDSFDISANDVLALSGKQDPLGSYNGASIVSKDRVYQELNPDASWNSVNGYVALAKDSYPALNPCSSGEKAVSSWTFRNPVRTLNGNNISWRNIKWLPEYSKFLVVSNGSSTLQISSDGINWSSVTTPSLLLYRQIAYSKKLNRTVVGTTGIGLNIVYSDDLINWNNIHLSNIRFESVVWSPELELFVASSSINNGTLFDRIIISSDGINWSEISSVDNLQAWRPLIWSAELGIFVNLAGKSNSNTTTKIQISKDGSNWTEYPLSIQGNWTEGVWSKELGLFVVVGDTSLENSSQPSRIITSPDGINWTDRTNPDPTANWYGITWSPQLGIFVVVGYDGDSNKPSMIISSNGIDWEINSNFNNTNRWVGIEWSPELGIFVASALGGSDRIITSNLGGRPPTTYNVFDSPFNKIDQDGTWTIKAKEIYGDNLLLDSNVDISGNLIVRGTTTNVSTQDLIIKDNLIVINQTMDTSGNVDPSGVLLNPTHFESGFVVYRGPEKQGDSVRPPYQFLFEESSNTFRVGQESQMQPVATREDNPTNNGVAVWDATDSRFVTDRGFIIDDSGNLDISGNLDLNCNLINDISGINFCDGTYIGQGNSFDISTNEVLHLKTSKNIILETTENLLNDDVLVKNILKIEGKIRNNHLTDNINYSLTVSQGNKIYEYDINKWSNVLINENDTGTFEKIIWADGAKNNLGWDGMFITYSSNRIFYSSSNGIDWIKSENISTGAYNSIAWSKELGIFVAVNISSSQGSPVLISDDGIIWKNINAVSGQWSDVIWTPDYNNGTFIALSREFRPTFKFMISNDGINWTGVNVTNNIPLNSITSGSITYSKELELFVTVGTGAIAYSNNGTNWTSIFSPDNPSPSNTQWNKVIWANNVINPSGNQGLFVASSRSVSSGDLFANIIISENGLNWTLVSTPIRNRWNGLAWSPEFKLFVAVASNTEDNTRLYDYEQIMISSDAVIWNLIPNTNNTLSLSWNAVEWSSKLGVFVAVGQQLNAESSRYRAMISADLTKNIIGVEDDPRIYRNENVEIRNTINVKEIKSETKGWNIISVKDDTNSSVGLYNVIWAEKSINGLEGDKLLATFGIRNDNSRNAYFYVSENGDNWIQSNLVSVGGRYQAVAWSPQLSRFVAMNYWGTAATSTKILTSTNGLQWQSISSTSTDLESRWSDVTWALLNPINNTGLFVGVALQRHTSTTQGRLITSDDGLTWTLRNLPTSPTIGTINPSNASWKSVAWSQELTRFVAVSLNRLIITSTNGTSWTGLTNPLGLTPASPSLGEDNQQWQKVIWAKNIDNFVGGEGLFIAISNRTGTDFNIATSHNGTNWTLRKIPEGFYASLSWSEEYKTLMAVSRSSSNSFYRSIITKDLVNWYPIRDPRLSGLIGVTWSPKLRRFTAVSSELEIEPNNLYNYSFDKELTIDGNVEISGNLTVTTTTGGFLPPRMTADQANEIESKVEGLLVYVKDNGGSPFNFTSKGWWGYDGEIWIKLG